MRADSYQVITGPPPYQQLDLVENGLEVSVAWLARSQDGTVTAAAGQVWARRHAGWPAGRIVPVQGPITRRRQD